MKAQSVDGLPSGYVRFLLDLDGKPGARRHGFEMEGTLTTKGFTVMNLNQLGGLYAKTKRYIKLGQMECYIYLWIMKNSRVLT